MGNISAVTDAEFEAQVLKSDKPVLVDFWAEWCGPCRQVAPILDEIATAHGDKITFFKMNVDENPVTPSSYRVTGIPTINVYQGGEVVKTIVGARPKADAAQRARRLHRADASAQLTRSRGPRRLRRRASRRFRAGRITPTSRSIAASTSSFQRTVVRRSIRIRGVVGCGRWVLNPTLPRKSAGTTAPPAPALRVAERLDRARTRRGRSGRGPCPAPASGPARRRGTRGRRTPWSAARRPVRPARSGSPRRRARTPPGA